jgi:hypothetical protein
MERNTTSEQRLKSPRSALVPEQTADNVIDPARHTRTKIRIVANSANLVPSPRQPVLPHKASSLNSIELKSIDALITFIAYENGVDKAAIAKKLLTQLKAGNLINVQPKDFDKAMRYLLALSPDQTPS